MKWLKCFSIILCLFYATEAKQEKNPLITSGLVDMDFYYIAHADTSGVYKNSEFQNFTEPGNSLKTNRSGMQFRRIFIDFDKKFNPRMKAKIRFHTLNKTYTNENKFTIYPKLKDCYLQYKFSNKYSMTLGLFSPPTYDYIRKTWNYRCVEKTINNLWKIRPVRDLGIKTTICLIPEHLILDVMVSNNSYEENMDNQTEKNKTIYGNLRYLINDQWTIDFYLDQDFGGETNIRKSVAQIFAAYRAKRYTIAAQITSKNQHDNQEEVMLFSIPAHLRLIDKLKILSRVDLREYKTGSETYQDILYIFGCDYQLDPAFSIIPNIEYAEYFSDEYESSHRDILLKITCFYKF